MAEPLVVFHPLALREYRKSRNWYAARSIDAEERFVRAVDHALCRITLDPEALPRMAGENRYVRVTGFPYVVVFRRVNSEFVKLIAVAHTSRRPGYWRQRQ
jgi:plasmid stabilization system protein ParE